MIKKEITILGAGLVGSLLAIYLSRRGHKVKVYERRPDMRREKIVAGRSINLALSDRGWKGLENAGLTDTIRKIAIPMQGRMVHAVDGSQNLQPYGKEGQAIYSVSRGELNKVLMNEAESNQNVTITFDRFCHHVDLAGRKIFFSASPADSNIIGSDSYDLLFGADGAYSALRLALQFQDRFNLSKSYIEHGYKELTIPAGKNGEHLLHKNALHIWPRKNFMLIALPNLDGSFTCTLFFQFDGPVSFSAIKSDEEIENFFREYFPDTIPLMPSYKEDFSRNPVASLVTVKCYPWSYKESACLIGDAAHAIVPFFGQGMNCGFEDCTVIDQLMNDHGDDWGAIFSTFQQNRKRDTDAIADLALNNFIEMRDLVADEHFLHKKKMEKLIAAQYPQQYISPYQMVSFSHIPYSTALEKGKAINAKLEELTQAGDPGTIIHSAEMKQWMDEVFTFNEG